MVRTNSFTNLLLEPLELINVLLVTNNIMFCLLYIPDKPFVGASVGYFTFLFLLAGRALTVSYNKLF